LDDVIGHRRSDGQVSAGRAESVLIGNPVNFDDGAIWSSVRVASLGHSSGVLGVELFDLASFFQLDAIAGFEAIINFLKIINF
jgi:hypothetical protein